MMATSDTLLARLLSISCLAISNRAAKRAVTMKRTSTTKRQLYAMEARREDAPGVWEWGRG